MSLTTHKFFTLTANWKDNDPYPLQIHGESESGPILIKLDSEAFTLFIENDKNISSFGDGYKIKDVPLKTFDGKSIKAVYLSSQSSFVIHQ